MNEILLDLIAAKVYLSKAGSGQVYFLTAVTTLACSYTLAWFGDDSHKVH
jgi:hypothetical protein